MRALWSLLGWVGVVAVVASAGAGCSDVITRDTPAFDDAAGDTSDADPSDAATQDDAAHAHDAGTDAALDAFDAASGADAATADAPSTTDADTAPDADVSGATDAATDATLDAADAAQDTHPDTPPDPAPPTAPARYTPGPLHSPMTPSVVARLRALADQGASLGRDPRVFAKVGDSITVSPHYLHCFDSDHVDLGAHTNLTDTWLHYLDGRVDNVSPYRRESLAATGGWPAFRAIEGDPSPLTQEIDAAQPSAAVVMFGTNDIGWDNRLAYAEDMWLLTDALIQAGVVPLLMTIPPRLDDRVDGRAQVPRYNAVVRAIAQAHQVPLIDYHSVMAALPDSGLVGDRVHPNVYRPSGARACHLTDAGLEFGTNARNWLTLAALDRLQHALDPATEPLDAPTPLPALGAGSPDDPFIIDALPFTHAATTEAAPHLLIDAYGCAPDTDESGPEVYYRLTLDRAASVRIMVVDLGSVDVDVHLLGASGQADDCIARGHHEATATLAPGAYTVVLDSFVSSQGEVRSGDYIVVVTEDAPTP